MEEENEEGPKNIHISPWNTVCTDVKKTLTQDNYNKEHPEANCEGGKQTDDKRNDTQQITASIYLRPPQQNLNNNNNNNNNNNTFNENLFNN